MPQPSQTIEICQVCREVVKINASPKRVGKEKARAELMAGERVAFICQSCVEYFRGLADEV